MSAGITAPTRSPEIGIWAMLPSSTARAEGGMSMASPPTATMGPMEIAGR